jgi:hypothetical protein
MQGENPLYPDPAGNFSNRECFFNATTFTPQDYTLVSLNSLFTALHYPNINRYGIAGIKRWDIIAQVFLSCFL